jgi:DNA-binding NtrC family response regulator
MPHMTGVELIEQLIELGVGDPVIVITGHADVPMAIQALKAGVSDFIEKPFADDAILSAITLALAKRDAAASAEQQRERDSRCHPNAFHGRTSAMNETLRVASYEVLGLPKVASQESTPRAPRPQNECRLDAAPRSVFRPPRVRPA